VGRAYARGIYGALDSGATAHKTKGRNRHAQGRNVHIQEEIFLLEIALGTLALSAIAFYARLATQWAAKRIENMTRKYKDLKDASISTEAEKAIDCLNKQFSEDLGTTSDRRKRR